MDSAEMMDFDAAIMDLELERADLDAQIDALIRQATERLREQLAELDRKDETAATSAGMTSSGSCSHQFGRAPRRRSLSMVSGALVPNRVR